MSRPVPRMVVVPASFPTLVDALRIDPSALAGFGVLGPSAGHSDDARKDSFCCFWDERSLYVLFSVAGTAEFARTGIIAPGETLCTPLLWELSEVVEVFVGPNARETGRYREFEVAPDGRWVALDVKTDAAGVRGNQAATEFRCAVERSPGGFWKAALEIPWDEIGGGDAVCHGNFYRSVPGEGGGLYAWSPTGSGPQCFHRPKSFGELVRIVR